MASGVISRMVELKQAAISLVLDAVLDVGLDPILDVGGDGCAAMHQGDARAVTPQLQGGDGRGVSGPDHHHIRVVVGMRLAVVVRHLGQIFAGDIEMVGQIVVAGGDDQLAREELGGTGERAGGVHQERAVGALDAVDRVILANVEAVELRDLAVVLQGLQAVGLLLRGDEGNVADLQQLRRGEEGHVGGVVVERVAQASLVHGNRGVAGAPGLDGAGQAGGTGSDDEYVELLHGFSRKI